MPGILLFLLVLLITSSFSLHCFFNHLFWLLVLCIAFFTIIFDANFQSHLWLDILPLTTEEKILICLITSSRAALVIMLFHPCSVWHISTIKQRPLFFSLRLSVVSNTITTFFQPDFTMSCLMTTRSCKRCL